MKILDNNYQKVDQWITHVCCKHCHSKLEIDVNDLQLSNPTGNHFYINCQACLRNCSYSNFELNIHTEQLKQDIVDLIENKR